MARKQIGIKLDEDDLARWDEWAESHGLTRTTLIETAVERFVSASVEQAPASSPAESRAEVGSGAPREHLARPGVRRAFICQHKGRDGQLDCFRRIFLPEGEEGVPDCPEHGAMMAQPNRPYMGQAT